MHRTMPIIHYTPRAVPYLMLAPASTKAKITETTHPGYNPVEFTQVLTLGSSPGNSVILAQVPTQLVGNRK